MSIKPITDSIAPAYTPKSQGTEIRCFLKTTLFVLSMLQIAQTASANNIDCAALKAQIVDADSEQADALEYLFVNTYRKTYRMNMLVQDGEVLKEEGCFKYWPLA